MNPMRSTHPELPPDAPKWNGLPVTCSTCQQAGVPIPAEDGWRLPVHRRYAGMGLSETCSGSLAAVAD